MTLVSNVDNFVEMGDFSWIFGLFYCKSVIKTVEKFVHFNPCKKTNQLSQYEICRNIATFNNRQYFKTIGTVVAVYSRYGMNL